MTILGAGKNEEDVKFDDTFVPLLTCHQTPLKQFIASLVPDVDSRNDILQEVNIVLWKKRMDFELGTNFKAWAFAVARLVTMSQQKKYRKKGCLFFETEVLEAISQHWKEADQNPDKRLSYLKECLGQLEKEQRQLLVDCYSSRGAIEQLAQEKQQSASTLRGILLRLRRRLHRCIQIKISQHQLRL